LGIGEHRITGGVKRKRERGQEKAERERERDSSTKYSIS
jgi:hypothetical protein